MMSTNQGSHHQKVGPYIDEIFIKETKESEKKMAIICRILTAAKLSDLKKETDCFMTKEKSKNFINRAKELSSED